jgi:hypothetical protein
MKINVAQDVSCGLGTDSGTQAFVVKIVSSVAEGSGCNINLQTLV